VAGGGAGGTGAGAAPDQNGGDQEWWQQSHFWMLATERGNWSAVAGSGQIQDLNHMRLSQAEWGRTLSVRIGQM
jgi:hypothetical protein